MASKQTIQVICKTTGVLCAVVVCLISWSFLSPVLSQDVATYKGLSYCKACHPAKVKGWEETRHARAFDTLKKTNQQDLPDCIKCHVTGYGEPGGFIDDELTPKMAGVQCEACHGPGSQHKGAKKDIIAAPGADKCRECHTPGQDPKFNFDEKKKTIHGQIKK